MIGSDVTADRQKREAFILEYPNRHETNSHWPSILGRSHVAHFAGEVRPEPMLELRPEPQQAWKFTCLKTPGSMTIRRELHRTTPCIVLNDSLPPFRLEATLPHIYHVQATLVLSL